MLNSAGNNSFSDLISVYLKGICPLNLEFWRHTASFKFWFSKVQDFGNSELSPMIVYTHKFLFLICLISDAMPGYCVPSVDDWQHQWQRQCPGLHQGQGQIKRSQCQISYPVWEFSSKTSFVCTVKKAESDKRTLNLSIEILMNFEAKK